jgi:peptide/nickel transport system substrate-binding protein
MSKSFLIDRRTLLFGGASSAALAALPVGMRWASAFQATPAPAQGGVLRAGIFSDFQDLEPHFPQGGGIASWMSNLLYEGFTFWDPKIIDGPQPALAERWEYSEDASVLTFYLRQGVKFHNGKELTSDDVKFSLERWLNPPELQPGQAPAGVGQTIAYNAKVEYPDAYTVVFNLAEPDGTAVPNLMFNIVPSDWTPDTPYGSGPFVFESWERNQLIKVTRFADYWQVPLPYLDGIEMYPAPDEDVKYLRLSSGEFDWIDGAPVARLPEITTNDELKIYRPVLNSYWLLMNMGGFEPVADARVRQAINYAIDRPGLSGVLYDVGVQWSYFPESHWSFNPDAIRYDVPNLDMAKQLLADAGYGDGFSAELMLPTTAYMIPTIAQYLQANLKEIGIDIKIVNYEVGKFHELLFATPVPQYQLPFTGGNANPDPAITYTNLGYNLPTTGAGWDPAKFPRATELSGLLASARLTTDQNELQQIYRQVHALFMEELPISVVSPHTLFHLSTNKVDGYAAGFSQAPNFRDVWLEQ